MDEEIILALRDVPNNDLVKIISNVYNVTFDGIDDIKNLDRDSTLDASRL